MKTIGIFFFLFLLGVGLVSAGLTVNFQPANGSGGGAVWGNITGNINDQTDLMNELDQKVSKSGDTMTGTLNMDSNKITNLAEGTDTQDAVNLGQLEDAIDGVSYTVEYGAGFRLATWNGVTTYAGRFNMLFSSDSGIEMPCDGELLGISYSLRVTSFLGIPVNVLGRPLINNVSPTGTSVTLNVNSAGFHSNSVMYSNPTSFNQGDLLSFNTRFIGSSTISGTGDIHAIVQLDC